MAADRYPVWHHDDGAVSVRMGLRVDPLPEPLDEWVSGAEGIGITDDPTDDLLRLDTHLRRIIADLRTRITPLGPSISDANAAIDHARDHPGIQTRVLARIARRDLAQAQDAHTHLSESLADVHTLLELLREYVIGLDPISGPLRSAADGWARDGRTPPSVIVFADEDSFLATDPRRGTTMSGSLGLDVEEYFGRSWRRDGDDDGPDDGLDSTLAQRQPIAQDGPWQIGHVPRTGEIIAVRRCAHLSSQVWLLGDTGSRGRTAADVLHPVLSRMREPNSLILAANTVHAAMASRCVATSRVRCEATSDGATS